MDGIFLFAGWPVALRQRRRLRPAAKIIIDPDFGFTPAFSPFIIYSRVASEQTGIDFGKTRKRRAFYVCETWTKAVRSIPPITEFVGETRWPR